MKKVVLSLTLVILLLGNATHAQRIWDDYEISLLTASPGEQLYSVFGHSAIRVKNEKTGQDIVFNYGMFSFSDPDFYLNFTRGRLNYWLGAGSYHRFQLSYTIDNRGIVEQVFEMDSVQKQFAINFLENNLKPENKFYPYQFFEDNCATRIRDLMQLAYKGIEFPAAEKEYTYRELIHQCLANHPWEKLGIDIILGLPTDRKTGMYEQMFLPDYLYTATAGAKYNGHGIVKETKTLFSPQPEQKQSLFAVTPFIVFCCIFALSVLFCFVKRGAKVFDFILFFITGIIGCIIFSLWFLTEHTDTQANFNIIWALPTHLFMSFFVFFKKHGRFYQKYFLATAVITILFLITWFVLPQQFNPALIPLIMSIALRALNNGMRKQP